MLIVNLFYVVTCFRTLYNDMQVKVNVSSYIAQIPVLGTVQSDFTLYFHDRPVQSSFVSTSLGGIQPYATVNARKLLVHISTDVYSQILIHTAE